MPSVPGSYTQKMILKWSFVSDAVGKDCTFIIHVFRDIELFKSVQFYLEDVLEMTGQLMVTLEWGETKWLLMWYPETEHFTPVG